MAIRYISGSIEPNKIVSKLSGTTRYLSTSLLQDPRKMENAIGMVRTIAPLTSSQTVKRVNTYLPAIEKISTLMSMYSFISRAQNYKPIQPLNAKTPGDKIAALLKSSNIPVTKLMTQPLLTNNMDKILGALAMNMAKNGGLDEMLSSLLRDNKDLKEMLSNLSSQDGKETDFNSLMEAFKPMLNSIMSPSEDTTELKEDEEYHVGEDPIFKSANFDFSEENTNGIKTEQLPSPKTIKNDKYGQKPIPIRPRRR